MLNINQNIKNNLESILVNHNDTNSFEFWYDYYDFIVLSYGYKDRYGLSGLANILHKYNVSNISQLIEVYARGLLILARSEGEEIYGEHFNP